MDCDKISASAKPTLYLLCMELIAKKKKKKKFPAGGSLTGGHGAAALVAPLLRLAFAQRRHLPSPLALRQQLHCHHVAVRRSVPVFSAAHQHATGQI